MVFLEENLPHINHANKPNRLPKVSIMCRCHFCYARSLHNTQEKVVKSKCACMTYTVEYPIIFERLYKAGVNGKMWRLLKEGGSTRVWVHAWLSEKYSVQRGAKQGSVLLYTSTVSVSYGSPLLKQLHCSMLGGFSMWITLELWRPARPACRHS